MAMREHDSLEPYEPSDPGYDWDYEPEDHSRNMPNILWGRVAVLGAVVLLAFLFGRMTSGGGGVPEERLTSARNDLRDARTQIADLQTERDDLQAQLDNLQTAGDPGTKEDTEGDGDGTGGGNDPSVESEVYTVQSGDTLNKIAERFYKDATLDDYIAEANDILDPSQLSVGAEIIIPPKPEE